MKRTNLVLDERLLEEAVRVSGERTYSRAVARALDDFVRRARAGKILDVLQEVLQGFADQRAYEVAREALRALPIVESPLRIEVVEEAVTAITASWPECRT